MAARVKSIGNLINVQVLAVVFLAVGLANGIVGYVVQHPGPFDLTKFMQDFYANVSTDLVSTAVTILVIDTLNTRRDRISEERREREQLTRQLGSSVNEVAKHAAEQLRANGWLMDGSLQETDLRVANLQGAGLWQADLQGANLHWAKLQKANLKRAVLCGVNLTQSSLHAAKLDRADLREADLRWSKLYRVSFSDADMREANLAKAYLQGARLDGANLQGAKLDGVQCDEKTILPDGTAWTAETDLARFTDPAHPQFWRAKAAAE